VTVFTIVGDGRPGLDDAAGGGKGVALVVGDEQHRQAGGAGALQDEPADFLAEVGIEAGEGLVQEQRPGLGQEAAGEGSPAFLAAREGAGVAGAQAFEADFGERRFGLGCARLAAFDVAGDGEDEIAGTVMCGKRSGSWSRRPRRGRSGGRWSRRWPSRVSRPWPLMPLGSVPAIQARRLDLPAPEGPMRVTISPEATVRSRASSRVWPAGRMVTLIEDEAGHRPSRRAARRARSGSKARTMPVADARRRSPPWARLTASVASVVMRPPPAKRVGK
jgi:hypothetical protein